jgi:hypothetical protein
MQLVIDRPRRAIAIISASAIVCAVIAAVALWDAPPAGATHSCSGVHIKPGNDLDAIVNRDPVDKATTFCIHAPSSGATYYINNTVHLRSGDKLIGQPGQVVRHGPASYGVPLVKIRNGGSVPKLIRLSGSNVVLRWLDIAGSAVKYSNGKALYSSGHAIDAWSANATARLAYLTIHDNPNSAINNMNGKLLHSNLYNNGTNSAFWAWTATAVKGVHEYEAAYNFVHDNPANGLWCDSMCQDRGAAMPNGFWVHHNLVVNNGRSGIRFEHSPQGLATGVHRSQPTALIENNQIHANGYKGSHYAGVEMHDAQNARIRNNVFGSKTIAGVFYRVNVNKRAIAFTDSGKSSRTDLWNGDAVRNALGGEMIVNCAKPDNVVYCADNRR